MTVEGFQDRDAEYLDWIAGNRAGYVINVGRSGRGLALLHRASCRTISRTPPFTGLYIKICATTSEELDQWALSKSGALPKRCGVCQPLMGTADVQQASVAGDEWQIEGPGDGQRQVRLWSNRYIPFERLPAGQRAARGALQERLLSLTPAADEILHATYTGRKPSGMDVENLVLYNIGSGCFRPGAKHGVRFELGCGPPPESPSGRRFECYYRYRLVNPNTGLTHWRPIRRLADFSGADLGPFPSTRRLEQVWFAIHRATPQTYGRPGDHTAPFSVFLTLDYPATRPVHANPELVKALIDGTVASFQAHGNSSSARELAAWVAASTGQPRDLIAQILLDDQRAILGVTDNLLHLRGNGVQWNPSDHLCVAGQVLIRPAPTTRWTLAGQIHTVEQAP